MNEYEFALYFWSSLVAIGLTVPFAGALVRWALGLLGHHDEPHSEPSLPSIPSLPSSPA